MAILSIQITVDPQLQGLVTGAGLKQTGDSVTLTGVPYTRKYFLNWTLPDGSISTDNPLTFVASASGTYKANFQNYVSVKVNTVGNGSVTGENLQAKPTDTITLAATPKTGQSFIGFYERGNLLSASTPYSFKTSGDRVIDPVFQNTEAPTHLVSGHFVYPPISVEQTDNDGHPMSSPDKVDTTSSTIIYEGWTSLNLVRKTDLSTPIIVKTWATGLWADRATLTYS